MARAWISGIEIGNPLAKWLFIVVFSVFAVIFVVATLPITIPFHFILRALGDKGVFYSIEVEDDDEQNPATGFCFKRG